MVGEFPAAAAHVVALNPLGELLGDFFGAHVGGNAEAHFGAGEGGNDGFGAFAHVAAVKAVDIAGGAYPAALQGVKMSFTKRRGAHVGSEVVFVERKCFKLLTHVVGEWRHVVVKMRDGDFVVVVKQFAQHAGELRARVGQAAAVDTRMQVA